MKLPPDEGLAAMRRLMDLLFDLGAFSALIWFCFRATRGLKARFAVWATNAHTKMYELLAPLLGTSVRILAIVVGIILGLPMLGLPPQ
jgi:hypothetical protein